MTCPIYCRDASLSPCAVMLGLLYMHRLVDKNPNYLTTTCSRDAFLASMVGTLICQYIVLHATMNVFTWYVLTLMCCVVIIFKYKPP